MSQFILINTGAEDSTPYPLDSVEQIEAAQDAMREHGMDSAPVYVGDPDDPDSYRAGHDLLAREPRVDLAHDQISAPYERMTR